MAEPAAEEFADRLLASALGFADILAAHLGDRLGWYRSLAAAGPSTAAELAERTGTSPRYAREWLEQQAVTGVLAVEGGATDAADRRFRLPPGVAEAVDWAEAATLLHGRGARWPDAFKRAIGVALKDEEDLRFVSGRLDGMLAEAAAA